MGIQTQIELQALAVQLAPVVLRKHLASPEWTIPYILLDILVLLVQLESPVSRRSDINGNIS